MRKISLLLLAALMAGCSTQTQQASIQPTVTTPIQDVGQERIVGFTIKDKRPTSTFAMTEDHNHMPVSTDRSLFYALSEDSEKMISAYGFTPADYSKVNGRNIEITLLSNEVSTKKIKGHVIHSAGVSILVKANNHGRLYQRVYSGTNAHNASTHHRYTSEEMVANVTQAYNQALDKIEHDKKLWKTLVG